MSFVQNFPFFSIIAAMFSGILSSVLDGKKARNLSLLVIAVTTGMSVMVLGFCMRTGGKLYLYDGAFSCTLGK